MASRILGKAGSMKLEERKRRRVPPQFISKVIADGRVTIPSKVRSKHAINEGDHVEILIIRIIKKTGEA